MSSTYDSAQASTSRLHAFSSTSTEETAPNERIYRWDYSPSVLLSSSSPAEQESLRGSQSRTSCEVDSELTSSYNHRIKRLPSVLPSTSPRPETFSPVAISSPSTFNYFNTSSQDVHSLVNTSAAYLPSTATRTGPAHVQLENTHSSSSSTNVSINQSQPSPQVYSELAAHYGIPQSLPRPPRTTTRPQSSPRSAPLPDFLSLSRDYLNMLSKPTDNSSTMPENTTASTTVDPAAMSAPVVPRKEDEDVLSNLDSVVETMLGDSPPPLTDDGYSVTDTPSPSFASLLASPEFQMSSTFEDYLTSPLANGTPYDDFNTSPMDDSPFTPDLNTPIMDDLGEFASSEYSEFPLFNDPASTWYLPEEPAKESNKLPETLNLEKLYTISPGTPSLDPVSVKSASLYHSARVPTSAPFAPPAPPPTTPATRRRSSATGTRKNITPASLVPIDAPTQSRRYITPSATSRKEVPAVFAKKRSRSQAFDEEDELATDDVLPPDATEKEQIEWKRRQNTLAARKSRKRKLEHQQYLENKVEELTRENEIWKTRTRTLEQILQSHGVPFRPFED